MQFLSNCLFYFSVILFSGEVRLLPLRLNFLAQFSSSNYLYICFSLSNI